MAKRKDVRQDKGEPTAATGDAPLLATLLLDQASSEPVQVSVTAEAPITEPTKAETPTIEPDGASTARPALAMPRAAILPPNPDAAPVVAPSANTDAAAKPALVAPSRDGPRGSRFALLAASVALAASVGAVGGSVGVVAWQQHVPVASATATHAVPNDEVRTLKETVVQLRANVKTLSDNLVALRSSINTSSSAANAQFAKLAESLDRVERSQGDRRAAVSTASPETTGSIPASPASATDPKAAAKLPIVDGWRLRKVYDGAALIEGRYGIVEIGPGELLPGVGRIQEIKRQDGRWVVVTPKGLIVPLR